MDRVGVLFVCLGNICRSPLAEGAFRHLVDEKGLAGRFLIDSAGTSTWHLGKPPHEMSCEVSRLTGFAIDHLRARQVTTADFHTFHYILAMDSHNLWELEARKPPASPARLDLLLNFATTGEKEVPDPYYGGLEEFHQVLSLVRDGSEGLLAAIERDHFS